VSHGETTVGPQAAGGSASTMPAWVRMIDIALVRVIVPLWILTGAVFKLVEFAPSTLPETIREPAANMGMDLHVLLPVLIGLEFLAVAVLFFIRPLARLMALFMLGVFCLILIGELLKGNTSCGCLGGASPPPWVMLAIDGAMLVGVLATSIAMLMAGERFLPWTPRLQRVPYIAAVALTAAGFSLSFGALAADINERQNIVSGQNDDDANGAPQNQPNDPRANPDAKSLPGYWMTTGDEPESWEGKSWREIDIFQYMKRLPSDMDAPLKYIVFYRRNCSHCATMFNNDFVHSAIGSKTTAIEVPMDKSTMTPPNPWPMPDTKCELMELPLGVDWIITTPLALRIENGIVTCANEGDHTPCISLR